MNKCIYSGIYSMYQIPARCRLLWCAEWCNYEETIFVGVLLRHFCHFVHARSSAEI